MCHALIEVRRTVVLCTVCGEGVSTALGFAVPVQTWLYIDTHLIYTW